MWTTCGRSAAGWDSERDSRQGRAAERRPRSDAFLAVMSQCRRLAACPPSDASGTWPAGRGSLAQRAAGPPKLAGPPRRCADDCGDTERTIRGPGAATRYRCALRNARHGTCRAVLAYPRDTIFPQLSLTDIKHARGHLTKISCLVSGRRLLAGSSSGFGRGRR